MNTQGMKRLTVAQVRRCACFRCKGRPGYSQWAICADGNKQRVLCKGCDIVLNRMVLRWAGFVDWQKTAREYALRVLQ